MKRREKVFLLNGEYYYIPHHLFEGIYELYWVNHSDADVPVQNFCRVESAETLAKEDKAWRRMGCRISNLNRVTYESRRVEERLKQPKIEEEPEEGEITLTKDTPSALTEQEKKREARKKRREARKAKEKKNG